MGCDVFISYRSEDKEWADRICSSLETGRLACWIAPRDIPLGKEWATAIVENLQQCRAFVIVLSSNSKNARQIAREAELADRAGLPIITVRVEDVQPPPGLVYFLGNIQWLDAFGGRFESAMGRLADVIGVATKPDAVTAAPTAIPEPEPPPPHISPVPPPPVLPDTPSSPAKGKWLGIGGAAVLLIGALAWFALARSHQAPVPTAAPQEITERFMALLQKQDLKGALQLTGPGLRGNALQDFVPNMRRIFSNRGAPVEASRATCTAQPGGRYACVSALRFQSSAMTLEFEVKDLRPPTGWAITALHYQF